MPGRIPGVATFGAKKTFADKTLKALFKGAKTTSEKMRRLDAFRKSGSVSKAISSKAGMAKAGAVAGMGAVLGAGLAGATAIKRAAKKGRIQEEKFQKEILERGEQLRQAAIKQRKSRMKK